MTLPGRFRTLVLLGLSGVLWLMTPSPTTAAPPGIDFLGTPVSDQLARLPNLADVRTTLGGRPRMEPPEYMGPAGNRYGAFADDPGFRGKIVGSYYHEDDRLFATIVKFDTARNAAAAVAANAVSWGTPVPGTIPGQVIGGARYWSYSGSDAERRLTAAYAVTADPTPTLLRVLCDRVDRPGGARERCTPSDLQAMIATMVRTPPAPTLTAESARLLPRTPPAGLTPILTTTPARWPTPVTGRAPAQPLWSWYRASGPLMRAMPEDTLTTQSVATADTRVSVEVSTVRVTSGARAAAFTANGCAQRDRGCRSERPATPLPAGAQMVSLGANFTELSGVEVRAVAQGRLLVAVCDVGGGLVTMSPEQIDICLALLPPVTAAYLGTAGGAAAG